MKRLFLLISLIFIVISCADGGKDGTDGVDGTVVSDTTGDTTTVYASNPSGFAEAGPFQGYSKVTMWPLDATYKQIGDPYIGNTKATDSGEFTVYADITSPFVKTLVEGKAFNETSGGFDENVSMESTIPGSAESFNANHFSTIVSIVGNYWFHEDVNGTYYNDPAAFTVAETVVHDYFDYSGSWSDPVKKSYEMTLTGDTLDDGKLVFINSTISYGKNGPEQGSFVQQIAEDIYSGNNALKASVNAITEGLQITSIKSNLDNYYASRSLPYDTAPLWELPGVPTYYSSLLSGSVEVVESKNTDQSSTCAIDINTKDSFAYAIVLLTPEDAKYLATELTGDHSIWSVGTCDNGVDTFDCPGTQLATVEELNEILLPSPGDLSYNGMLSDDHGLMPGQYFLVQNLDSPAAPSHTCSGTMISFGRNLATVGNDWVNAVGVGNLSSWFRREIKWVTMKPSE